ncbi:hypothetical protein C2E23DRAFT_327624 [Lenzites betulinus]|nr:hypothetical protein C2E23DRAFT_327624 [Lenzites betulinus]
MPLYPPVQAIRNVEVAYTSCAVHPQGLNVFEVQKIPSGGRLAKNDIVNLTYKRANDGWVVHTEVKLTRIRTFDRASVEFVAERCSLVPGDERDHLPYVLLHVPRTHVRGLGWWPIVQYIIGRPWAASTIPSTIQWKPRSQFPRGRLPIEVRRILEPERPDVEEICELLRKVPVEIIMEVTRRDGTIIGITRALADDADVAA